MDMINALFLLLVAFCRYKHWIQGAGILPAVLLLSWGGWNVYYYGELQQWHSLCASALLVISGLVWLVVTIYRGRLRSSVIGEVINGC